MDWFTLKKYIFCEMDSGEAVNIEKIREQLMSEPEPQMVNERAEHIYNEIKATNGQIRVSDLAAAAGCSERHIHRLLTMTYGVGPKECMRVVRVRCTIMRMLDNPELDVTSYMEGVGFSDQAHFQREFKWYTGVTPRTFLRLLASAET